MTIVTGIVIPKKYIKTVPRDTQDVTPAGARSFVQSINKKDSPLQVDHAITELAAHVAHHKSGKSLYDMSKKELHDAFHYITSQPHTLKDGSILDLQNYTPFVHVDSAAITPAGDVVAAVEFDGELMPTTRRLMELGLVAFSATIKSSDTTGNNLESIELSLVPKPAREGSVICNIAETQNDHEAYIRKLFVDTKMDPRPTPDQHTENMADSASATTDTVMDDAAKTVSPSTKTLLRENTTPAQPETIEQKIAQMREAMKSMPPEQQKASMTLFTPLLDKLAEQNKELADAAAREKALTAASKVRTQQQAGFFDKQMIERTLEPNAELIQREYGMTVPEFARHITNPELTADERLPLAQSALVMSGLAASNVDFGAMSQPSVSNKIADTGKRQRAAAPGEYPVDEDAFARIADSLHNNNFNNADHLRNLAMRSA